MEFQPVILGSDAGAYALARDFHQAQGIISHTVTETPRGPINDSAILHQHFIGPGGRKKHGVLLDGLVRAARDVQGTPVLFPLIDSDVKWCLDHRAALEEAGYFLPFSSPSVITQAANKDHIGTLAEEFGLEKVPTWDVNVQEDDLEAVLDQVSYPCVIKPREGSTTFKAQSFAGHKKAYCCTKREDAAHVLSTIRDAGYSGHMLVQQMILGDDSASWIITGYVARDGSITSLATAQQLIGIHHPQLIGNAGLITVKEHPLLRELGAYVLTRLGLRGFFAIDVKIDSHTGKPYLLDVNTRWGRSTYYARLAGMSPAEAFLADYQSLADIQASREFLDADVIPEGRDVFAARAAAATLPAQREEHTLYGIVSPLALRFWLPPTPTRSEALKLAHRRAYVHPLAYDLDRNLKRSFYIAAAGINQMRSLWTYRAARGEDRF